MANLLNMFYQENEEEVIRENCTVILTKPCFFDDVKLIAEEIKSGKCVVLNTENIKPTDITRIIDYLSGVVFALDGTLAKTSSGCYFVAPANIDVTSEAIDLNENL